MALSIGFRILSLLPSCYSSYGVLNSYPGGTFTHCSCQPSLDAHLSGPILSPLVDSPSGRFYSRRARATLNDARQRNTTALSGKHGNVLTCLDPFSQR